MGFLYFIVSFTTFFLQTTKKHKPKKQKWLRTPRSPPRRSLLPSPRLPRRPPPRRPPPRRSPRRPSRRPPPRRSPRRPPVRRPPPRRPPRRLPRRPPPRRPPRSKKKIIISRYFYLFLQHLSSFFFLCIQ